MSPGRQRLHLHARRWKLLPPLLPSSLEPLLRPSSLEPWCHVPKSPPCVVVRPRRHAMCPRRCLCSLAASHWSSSPCRPQCCLVPPHPEAAPPRSDAALHAAALPRPHRTTSLDTTPPRPPSPELGLGRERERGAQNERDIRYLDNERMRERGNKEERKKGRKEKRNKEMNCL
jgi:hypothetical protein